MVDKRKQARDAAKKNNPKPKGSPAAQPPEKPRPKPRLKVIGPRQTAATSTEAQDGAEDGYDYSVDDEMTGNSPSPKRYHDGITPPPEVDEETQKEVSEAVTALLGMKNRDHRIPLTAVLDTMSAKKRKRPQAAEVDAGQISSDGNEDGRHGTHGREDSDSQSGASDAESLEAGTYAISIMMQVNNAQSGVTDESFELVFSVPVDGANEKLVVQSDIKWKDLLTELADKMSAAPKNVKVSYRFSTDPRNAPFNHLMSQLHLMELVESAKETLEARQTSKSMKKFVVELKDMRPVEPKGKAKDDKGKKVRSESDDHGKS